MGKKDLMAGEVGADAGAVDGVVVAAGPVLAQEPAGGWPVDAFTGQPGSYVRDAVTGLRSPMPGDATAALVAARLAQEAVAQRAEDARVAALQAAE